MKTLIFSGLLKNITGLECQTSIKEIQMTLGFTIPTTPQWQHGVTGKSQQVDNLCHVSYKLVLFLAYETYNVEYLYWQIQSLDNEDCIDTIGVSMFKDNQAPI